MYHGAIIWRGIVYTILMILGKLVCGLVLVRFEASTRLSNIPPDNHTLAKAVITAPADDIPCRQSNDHIATPSESAQAAEQYGIADLPPSPPPSTTSCKDRHIAATLSKPQSLYPAALLGSAMVARGEIGFLISSLAESTGVFSASSASGNESSEMFLVVTWAVLLCTVIGPVSVGIWVKRVKRLQSRERGLRTGREDPLGVWGVM